MSKSSPLLFTKNKEISSEALVDVIERFRLIRDALLDTAYVLTILVQSENRHRDKNYSKALRGLMNILDTAFCYSVGGISTIAEEAPLESAYALRVAEKTTIEILTKMGIPNAKSEFTGTLQRR